MRFHFHDTRILRRFVLGLTALAAAGCGSNPFRESYVGEVHPGVSEARATTGPPAGAREIGRSEFVTDGGASESEALSAARDVGADYVHWGGAYDGTSREVDYRPVSVPVFGTSFGYYGGRRRHGYGFGTSFGYATAYQPYAYDRPWYRYSAVYYRSHALDVP
jgi:hypothetical protein